MNQEDYGDCQPQAASDLIARCQRKPADASQLLERAAQIVAGDRQAQHGPKERNHQNIAILWRAYMDLKGLNTGDIDIDGFDVAQMMVLLKVARTFAGAGRANPDNYVDMAGYAGVAGEIALNGKEVS